MPKLFRKFVVITERLPVHTGSTSVKEIILPQSPKQLKDDGGQSFSMNTASLLRVSLSYSIPGSRVSVSAAESESSESPVKKNPPCSPTSSPSRTNSPALPPTSCGSFDKCTEDGLVRVGGLVKEAASKDAKCVKTLANDMERSRVPPGTMRYLVNEKRVSGMKSNGATTLIAKLISNIFNESHPRINAVLWEESPHSPNKSSNIMHTDERPLTEGRSNLDWEKTLQEAASASLPPPDFEQILQECGQCGRTFKPGAYERLSCCVMEFRCRNPNLCLHDIRLWDLAHREMITQFPGHKGVVRGLAISSDGMNLVSCGDDCTVRLWELPGPRGVSQGDENNEEPVAIFQGKNVFRAIDHHWNNKQFATGSAQVDIWDHNRLEPINTFTWGADTVVSVRFNPSEPDIIASTASDHNIALYDLRMKMKRIERHRHLPKPIYKAAKLRQNVQDAENKRVSKKRTHSAPGAVPHLSVRKKRIVTKLE